MSISNPAYNVVFKPIPNSSQQFAIDTRCHETLYCGTRGGGKSITQLMAFAKYCSIGYGRFWRGVIFDKQYKNLDDLISKSHQVFGQLPNCKFNKKDTKWVWNTGEELLFRQLERDEDYWNYHGHEYPFIGWNELTKYATSYLYETMKSCNRSGFEPAEHPQIDAKGHIYYLPPIPLMVFSTTNPNGAGSNWVRRKFIDVAPYGQIVTNTSELFNPKTQRVEKVQRTQVAIFSSFTENPYLDPSYIASLTNHPDENVRKAWALGSWDITSGGAIGDLWDRSIHVIPRFEIPSSWYIDRTFDWGSSHPFAVCWWAETNGEEVEILMPDGSKRIFAPPAGSLVQFYEWYGTEEIGTNKGLQMPASEIAKGIVQIEDNLVRNGYITRYPNAGAADNQIWNRTNSDNDSIAIVMSNHYVEWERSDKSAGSRKNGLELLRNRLYNAKVNNEEPHIYFMDNCVASIATLPVLPRDEKNIDDVDTKSEDHVYDAVRYRCLDRDNTMITTFGV